ncbi:MAG: DUF2075 domain-containing protein [Clostridia bacterium]|nr:DUF2075 domain-containing protein [Clostridia bacterium]
MEILNYDFTSEGKIKVLDHPLGQNWPVVYLIHNKTSIYVGETNNFFARFGQHLDNPARKKLTNMTVIYDEEFNKSAILDIEQSLIRLFSADEKYTLLNGNSGQSAKHNYYQREKYLNKIEGSENEKGIWTLLEEIGLAKNGYSSIVNSDLFTYSPYTSLTLEQEAICYSVVEDLIDGLENHRYRGTSCIVDGVAGTGKTIIGVYLVALLVNANKQLVDIDENADLDTSSVKLRALHKLREYVRKHGEIKIAYVLPMTSIRKTIKKVFRLSKNGLKASMVKGPTEIVDEMYDIIIVDEAHRLSKRENIGWMGAFDGACKKLNLDPQQSNCLDWIVKCSKCRVLFYDPTQRIKRSDITPLDLRTSLENSFMHTYQLTTQMRCVAGSGYSNYLAQIFDCSQETKMHFAKADIKLFVSATEMIDAIKTKNDKYGLSRVVAGYSWEWKTKGLSREESIKQGAYDISLEGKQYVWNVTNCEWILRKDSINEIGCVHTTQGYDLNYVGVIFGREIDYDPVRNEIVIDKDLFFDKNVKLGSTDEETKSFVLNAYKVMMTRGIKGCYIYCCNPNLREYFKRFFDFI